MVAGPVKDERRYTNRRQHLPDVDVRVHAQERCCRPGARGASEVALEVAPELLVPDAARGVILNILRAKAAPVMLDVFRRLFPVLGGRRPSVVVSRMSARPGAGECDPDRPPLGM